MSLAVYLASVTISNNTIDVGNGAGPPASITNFYYTNCISLWSGLCGTITNNTISGCIGNPFTSHNLIFLQFGSAMVANNIFRRATTPCGAYIHTAGDRDQIIMGNIFDQPTTNGTSSMLVDGYGPGTIFLNNYNQD